MYSTWSVNDRAGSNLTPRYFILFVLVIFSFPKCISWRVILMHLWRVPKIMKWVLSQLRDSLLYWNQGYTVVIMLLRPASMSWLFLPTTDLCDLANQGHNSRTNRLSQGPMGKLYTKHQYDSSNTFWLIVQKWESSDRRMGGQHHNIIRPYDGRIISDNMVFLLSNSWD